jgi:hypothetical protein
VACRRHQAAPLESEQLLARRAHRREPPVVAHRPAELYLCEWHLRHALERLMGKIRGEEPGHHDAVDELLADVEAAFTGPSFWVPFLKRAHDAGIPRLSEWLNSTGRIVEDQFSRRGRRSTRPADMPLSTSPLDGLINRSAPRSSRAPTP